MNKLWVSLVLSGMLVSPVIECKNAHKKIEELTLANKNTFLNTTYLYIDNMPCSNGNIEVIVRLVGIPKSGQYTHTSSLYVPASITRNGKVGNYTHTYMYNFREITEPLACKLIVTTITHPHAGQTSYVAPKVEEYYFEVDPIGMLGWLKFWE